MQQNNNTNIIKHILLFENGTIYVFSYVESEFSRKNYLSCFDCVIQFKFK